MLLSNAGNAQTNQKGEERYAMYHTSMFSQGYNVKLRILLIVMPLKNKANGVNLPFETYYDEKMYLAFGFMDDLR